MYVSQFPQCSARVGYSADDAAYRVIGQSGTMPALAGGLGVRGRQGLAGLRGVKWRVVCTCAAASDRAHWPWPRTGGWLHIRGSTRGRRRHACAPARADAVGLADARGCWFPRALGSALHRSIAQCQRRQINQSCEHDRWMTCDRAGFYFYQDHTCTRAADP